MGSVGIIPVEVIGEGNVDPESRFIQHGTIIGKKGLVIRPETVVGVKTGGKRDVLGTEGVIIGKKGLMIGVGTIEGVVTGRGP